MTGPRRILGERQAAPVVALPVFLSAGTPNVWRSPGLRKHERARKQRAHTSRAQRDSANLGAAAGRATGGFWPGGDETYGHKWCPVGVAPGPQSAPHVKLWDSWP